MIARLRISHKLMLINLALGLTVLMVAGTLLLWQTHRQQDEFLQRRVTQLGEIVARNLSGPMLFEDWPTCEALLRALDEERAITEAVLLDVDRRAVVRLSRADVAGRPGGVLARSIAIEDEFGMLLGSLEITASRAEVAVATRGALTTVLATTLVAMLAGLALTLRSQRMVTEPLRKLTELVRRVRETKNYRLRGDVLHPDDLGRLTEDVNAMLEIIEQRDRDLARTVEVRTRELETQNQRLQREIRERERSERAARATEAKFENAFLNAPIGMALVVSDGKVIQRNSVFDDILDSGTGQPVSLPGLVVEDEREALLAQLGRLAAGEMQSFKADVGCRGRGGAALTCVMHFSAICDEGEFLYAVLQLQDVTESKRLAAELEHQARHDALTGLANRREFERTLAELARGGGAGDYPITLALIDLDQFKIVNDTCGHEAGDALLCQVSDTIRGCVRQSDLVVRLGGDEFAVVLRRCDAHHGITIAETIRAQIEHLAFSWEGSTFRVGASIGVVPISERPEDLQAVLRKADAACFAAKDGGRNRICVVEADNDAAAEKQGEMHWAQRLHTAIDNNRFALFGQRILALSEPDAPRRVEILLRMRDESGAPSIPPGAFLPVAERYGIATLLDRWVVSHLLERLATTPAAAYPADRFWVNLSGASLGDEKFLDFLEGAIGEAGLAPGTINFEVTETAAIRNVSATRAAMERLRARGCHFALDDFGSGVSSFGYLKTLPVDYLKIDGMFVRDIADDKVDRIFVKSIIDIARTMDIRTCAEFVESAQILQIVRELGADFAQGYEIGRPEELFAPTADDAYAVEPAAVADADVDLDVDTSDAA